MLSSLSFPPATARRRSPCSPPSRRGPSSTCSRRARRDGPRPSATATVSSSIPAWARAPGAPGGCALRLTAAGFVPRRLGLRPEPRPARPPAGLARPARRRRRGGNRARRPQGEPRRLEPRRHLRARDRPRRAGRRAPGGHARQPVRRRGRRDPCRLAVSVAQRLGAAAVAPSAPGSAAPLPVPSTSIFSKADGIVPWQRLPAEGRAARREHRGAGSQPPRHGHASRGARARRRASGAARRAWKPYASQPRRGPARRPLTAP